KRVGGKATKPIKRPLLLSRNRLSRLRFARALAGWTVDDWSRVVWTDETVIKRIRHDSSQYVWTFDNQTRTKGDKHTVDESRVVGTAKFGGGGIAVWSCMTWEGPGFL